MDISLPRLFLGLLLMLIPVLIHQYYKTGQTKSIIISCIRMVVQLFLVGFYLEYLFEWNNPWINMAWLVIMVGVCAIELIGRLRLSRKIFLATVYGAIFVSVFLTITYFLKVVLGLEFLFESRYFIPLCGSLMGNVLGSNVIGLGALYEGLEREQQYYFYMLSNGASCAESVRPFIREALRKAFNPSIASMAVMGLISMPGTMIGQILGGSSPNVAIRYQIMIMVLHFACSTVSLVLILNISIRQALDGYGLLREDVFRR